MIQLAAPVVRPSPTRGGASLRVLLALAGAAGREKLAAGLAAEGLRVTQAANAPDALRRVAADRPHAIILTASLDVAAPVPDCPERSDATAADGGGLDRLALCRALRAGAVGRATAIVVLSPSLTDASVTAAYEAGADACLPASCSARVLAARLLALASHRAAPHAGAAPFRVAEWAIDPETREAHNGAGRVVRLAGNEARTLALLASNAGHTVPTARLRESAETAEVRQSVARLRRKLGLLRTGPGALEAHSGLGYRLARPPLPWERRAKTCGSS